MRNSEKGFTLIELIITIVLISILAMITMPMLGNTVEIGNGNRAIANLRIIAASATMWFNDTGTTTAQVYGDLAAINTKFTLTIADPNFTYSGNQTREVYAFTATRNSGTQSGRIITIDNAGTIGGTWRWL